MLEHNEQRPIYLCKTRYIFALTPYKGGRFSNKFRKSQIRKFADSYNLSDVRTFRKCGTLQICEPNPFSMMRGFVCTYCNTVV
jgi:hypothetical protein